MIVMYMKNKKNTGRYLIVAIIILIVIAIAYTTFNKDRVLSFLNTFEKGNESNNSEKDKDELEEEKKEPSNPSDLDDIPSGDDESDPSVSPDDEPNKDNENDPPVTPDREPNEDYGFKKVTTYLEFESLLARQNKNTYFVFGRTGCYYCEQFVPVLQNVVEKYKIEVIYLDLAAFNPSDYSNVLNTSLTIPAKCSKTGQDTELRNGFGTPLSLFVNNKKTYSCIRGYKDEDKLVAALKANGYIKY